jgi:phosphatidylglycerol:prolipoprotein diacylglycerol transferase
MYPHDVHLFGADLGVWNLALVLGILLGYPVLRLACRYRQGEPLPRLLLVRWGVTAYLSALGAQLFGYLFDLNTTILPPPSVGWGRYYLDPLFGAKVLYGAVLFLPLVVLPVSTPWRDLDYGAALDSWTPPMFAVLGVARIGCFLQGCCYGVPSTFFGLSMPPGGSLYYRQLEAGWIASDSRTLPVVPTQAIEALVLFLLCGLSLRALNAGRRQIFPHGVAAYSVLRFAIEFVRDDPVRNVFGPFSTSQWIALGLLGAYAAWRTAART